MVQVERIQEKKVGGFFRGQIVNNNEFYYKWEPREIDHWDGTGEAGSLIKRPGCKSRHGITVIHFRKGWSRSHARYIRKADPTTFANGLGVKGGGKREIYHDSQFEDLSKMLCYWLSWRSLGQDLFRVQVKVKLLSLVQPFVTQWTVVYQASRSMGFSRQEYQSGLPFPSPGDLPYPGIEPRSPALQADTLPSEPPGKPCSGWKYQKNSKKLGHVTSNRHLRCLLDIQVEP